VADATAPPTGAPFALSAQVVGGPQLRARASELAPIVGDAVDISANVVWDGRSLEVESFAGTVAVPDDVQRGLRFDASGRATFVADRPGLHVITVHAHGTTVDGWTFDRSVGLMVEVRPR
jgi:hypothetical protein